MNSDMKRFNLDNYYLSDSLQYAEKYKTVEDTRHCVDVKVLKDSKYKCDIYKVVQALEFVERGV